MLKKEKQKEEGQRKDFYVDERGLVVFTESFLKKRGFCCENGCKHCPYKLSTLGFAKGNINKGKENPY